MVTKEISLKIWEENRVLIYTIQGEVDSRKLEISFTEQNGNNLNLSGKSISLYVRKPDGTQIYNNCIIDTNTNTAIITITSQIVSAVGILECEFQIFDSDNLLLKVNGLKIMVIPQGDFSQAIESTSEYNALITAINQAKTYSETSIQGIKVNNTLIPTDSDNVVNILTSNNSIPTVEKGEWTPKLVCPDGTDPTYTAEYTFSYYYRIGDLVYITFFMYVHISKVGSGTAYIDGLPFIVLENTNRQAIAISAYGSLNVKTSFYAATETSTIRVGILSGGAQNWVTGDMYIGGSGCYLKA